MSAGQIIDVPIRAVVLRGVIEDNVNVTICSGEMRRSRVLLPCKPKEETAMKMKIKAIKHHVASEQRRPPARQFACSLVP
jgi:hypothetical protein